MVRIQRKNIHNEILVRLVRRLPLLLPCTHKPPPRNDAKLDLGEMDLHHHTLFSGVQVAHFRDPISRPSNLQKHLALDVALRRRNHQLCVFGIARRTSSQIGLVLFALRVGEVRAFIGVQRQAKSAFE